jgi:beta-phosphoglucomutase
MLKETSLVYKAGIFDLDGVLTSTEKFHKPSFKIVHESIPGFLEKGEYSDEEFEEFASGIARDQVFRLTLGSRGIPFSENQIQNWSQQKQDIYFQFLTEQGPTVYSEAVQFAKSLKDRGVKLAIGSTSTNTPFILGQTGLSSLFEVVVAGNMVIVDDRKEVVPLKGKPEPDIFLEASKRLKIEPRACVGFGDADKDILAFSKAGIFCVGVNRSNIESKLREAGANLVVPELDFTPEYLDKKMRQYLAQAQ